MKCSEYCYPCCSYCIYVMKELREINGITYTAKVSCGKYPHSSYHTSMVHNDGYCKDFICENAEIKNKE